MKKIRLSADPDTKEYARLSGLGQEQKVEAPIPTQIKRLFPAGNCHGAGYSRLCTDHWFEVDWGLPGSSAAPNHGRSLCGD
jgi:hypothetical protein